MGLKLALNDSYRNILYFPMGLIPSIFFALRLLIQWYQSERKKTSYVSCGFWKLSLLGNVSLFLHHFVQVQYPFAMIQSLNALISWRNLNLINSKKPHSKKTALLIGVFLLIFTTLMFLVQAYFLVGEIDWIRTPQKPWDTFRQYHSIHLHIFGTLGGIILSSRFWVQWWMAENKKSSDLNRTFWYLSIAGSMMLIIYAIQIKDFVVFFYSCFGLVPYFRNLLLIHKTTQKYPETRNLVREDK